MGFSLGIMQGILCLLYPRKGHDAMFGHDTAVLETRPLAQDEEGNEPQQGHHHRHERLKGSVVESRNVV
jgi:hypothetical protein